MRVAIVAHRPEASNSDLADGWRRAGVDAAVVTPDEAVRGLGRGDVALLRLDILPTLDGFEPGLDRVPDPRRAGVRILNPPFALLGAHDKLETARRLRRAGIPHPRTAHVCGVDEPIPLEPPVVVKPRYGSWGRDVFRCITERELRACLRAVEARSWFRRQGALVQELLPPPPRDLRLVVAGRSIVGAGAREPAAGEWRTNVSLGGRLHGAEPGEDVCALALAAVEAVGGDLVGVDLLPLPGGGAMVLELNGAVEFDERYSRGGTDVFEEAARALGLLPTRDESVQHRTAGRRFRTMRTGGRHEKVET